MFILEALKEPLVIIYSGYSIERSHRMDIKTKREKIIKYILDVVNMIDTTGTNGKRYIEFFSKMNDQDFSQYMEYLREGRVQIYIQAPNMVIPIKMENLKEVAKYTGVELFERIWLTDQATGKKYLTPHKYFIIYTFMRRVRQYLDKKMSLPENDKYVDGLTGQVTNTAKHKSQAAALSQVEMQALAARGFNNTILELMKVRGGDIHAYANFKRQLEETGVAHLSEIENDSVPRSATMMGVFLKAMHLDNNLVER